jgi:NAD(P)-dependent dehydrogenase (short-subunit alcohol dehydrogenase family)
VLEFFETSTRNLLAGEAKSGDASAPPNMSQPRFSTCAPMTQSSWWKRHSLSTEASSPGNPQPGILPAAVFLASDDSKWTTGETLLISGGLR